MVPELASKTVSARLSAARRSRQLRPAAAPDALAGARRPRLPCPARRLPRRRSRAESSARRAASGPPRAFSPHSSSWPRSSSSGAMPPGRPTPARATCCRWRRVRRLPRCRRRSGVAGATARRRCGRGRLRLPARPQRLGIAPPPGAQRASSPRASSRSCARSTEKGIRTGYADFSLAAPVTMFTRERITFSASLGPTPGLLLAEARESGEGARARTPTSSSPRQDVEAFRQTLEALGVTYRFDPEPYPDLLRFLPTGAARGGRRAPECAAADAGARSESRRPSHRDSTPLRPCFACGLSLTPAG